jgi:thioesterase domain-containing protein
MEEALKASGKSLFRLREGKGPALVVTPHISGSLICYRYFMSELDKERALYLLNPFMGAGEDPKGARPFMDSALLLAESLAKDLSQSFPEGDFYLLAAGHKALWALELAREFRENSGVPPKGVVILDGIMPKEGRGDGFSPPAEKDLETILESLFHYEGVTHQREGVEKKALLGELRFWATVRAKKAKAKLISIRSKEGISPESFPLETSKEPVLSLAENEAEDRVFDCDHFELFKKENAERILKIIFP